MLLPLTKISLAYNPGFGHQDKYPKNPVGFIGGPTIMQMDHIMGSLNKKLF